MGTAVAFPRLAVAELDSLVEDIRLDRTVEREAEDREPRRQLGVTYRGRRGIARRRIR